MNTLHEKIYEHLSHSHWVGSHCCILSYYNLTDQMNEKRHVHNISSWGSGT